MVYGYGDQREAAFDIHTSWVTPDNFQGMSNRKSSFVLTMVSGLATVAAVASSVLWKERHQWR